MTQFTPPPPPPAPVLNDDVPPDHDVDYQGRGRPRIYPWDDWLDGQRAWILTPGDDFICTVRSFLNQARRAAKQRSMYLRYVYDESTALEDTMELTIWAVERNT